MRITLEWAKGLEVRKGILDKFLSIIGSGAMAFINPKG